MVKSRLVARSRLSSAAIELEWEHPEELAFLFEPHRYKVALGGRAGTKSWGFARALLILGWQGPIRWLCAREVQKSIKDSVYLLLKDQISLLGLDHFYDVRATEIVGLNGTRFVFTGLSDKTSLSIKSYEGFDGVWCEEAVNITQRSWDLLIPTIRKEGSEIWISFNPELDTDETYVRFVEDPPPDAVVVKVGYETNPWLPPIMDAERREFLRKVESGARSQEDYDNIWLGKCRSSVPGAIYAPQISKMVEDGRYCDVPYDPRFPVHTIWDLGWNDKMAIVFVQVVAGAIRVIDYIEDSHKTYDEYVDMIRAKKYRLAEIEGWLPHDGKAHNPQTGKSPIEYLNDIGFAADWEGVPEIGVEAGIKSVREMFPRMYIDRTNCRLLFNRLQRYARRINKETNEPQAPKRDENAHGADGVRYTAVIENQLVNERAVINEGGPRSFTF